MSAVLSLQTTRELAEPETIPSDVSSLSTKIQQAMSESYSTDRSFESHMKD